LRLRGGDFCYSWLDALGIAHEPLGPLAEVSDPVRVLGPIGGVEYRSQGQAGFVADCRLVLALDWTSRVLSRHGVTRIEHSGAYSYRRTRSGRLSLHARGLAIDVHGFGFGAMTHWVERDFERGRGEGCSVDAAAVNRVTCDLRRLRLFRELITPDHDSDHHDHIHLGIAQWPG
jgi:hypothetical protein